MNSFMHVCRCQLVSTVVLVYVHSLQQCNNISFQPCHNINARKSQLAVVAMPDPRLTEAARARDALAGYCQDRKTVIT